MKLKDTNVLVKVVPIFAPIIIGIASENSIEPDATIATIMEVLVLLLWIMAVIKRPIKRLIKGFAVRFIIESAISLFNSLNEYPIKSIAKRNKKIVNAINNNLFKVTCHLGSLFITGLLIVLIGL
jgi:dolichyl-phosphate-mannose--protein O-mannosyl transferase